MIYIISKYDPSDHFGKDGDWTTVATRKTKAGARKIVAKLESQGYDRDVSIAVDSEDEVDLGCGDYLEEE